MDKFFNGEWVRKAAAGEVENDKEHQKGHLLIWYQMDLSSKVPIREEQVKATLEHLYRKSPNLSVCYGTKNGETWFRRATNPQVDFKVHDGVSLAEVRKSLRSYRYSSNTGPLFCGRLLFNSPDPDEGSIDLDPSFPHKSHVIIGLHHGVTDGTSNMCIMGFFISLLNDIIANKPINDEELLGTFASAEETQRLIMEKKEQLEKDTELQQRMAKDVKQRQESTVLVNEAFRNHGKNIATDSIVRILDQNSTVKFIQRCRQEKVTVTSVFTAIVNMAFMDVAIQQGFSRDIYTIANVHTVNLRRYWKTNDFNPLGLHMDYPLFFFTETPKDVRSNFWSYAKSVGSAMKNEVISGRILTEKAYALLASEKKTAGDESSHSSKAPKFDYITSCMGDITPRLTEGGDHVKINNLVRGTSFHLYPYPALVNCHTFRNIFTIIFEYSMTIIDSSLAEAITDQIVHNIRELIK